MRPGWPSPPPRKASPPRGCTPGRPSPTPPFPRFGTSPSRPYGGGTAREDSHPVSDIEELLARKEYGAALQSALKASESGSGGGAISCQAVGAPTRERDAEEAAAKAIQANGSGKDVVGDGSVSTPRPLPLLRKVLTSVPESRIDDALGALTSTAERDALMRALYHVLGDRSASCASSALRWHGRLVEFAGPGSIMRVLTNRRWRRGES